MCRYVHIMIDRAHAPVRPQDSWQFILAIFFSILLMILDDQTRLMVQARMVISATLEPLRWLAQVPQTAVRTVEEAFIGRAKLIDELEKLRNQNLLLNQQIQQLDRLDHENNRLKMLLGMSAQINSGRLLIGAVTDYAPDPYRHIIRINRGYLDGVREGQPVMDANSLIGQVLATTPYSSDILLLIDHLAQIPVRVVRTGARGIAQGSGGNQLVLKFIPTTQDIKSGDLVETSGMDGRYPAGMPIGKIDQIHNLSGSLFWQAKISLLSQAATSREVLILIQPAASTPVSPTP